MFTIKLQTRARAIEVCISLSLPGQFSRIFFHFFDLTAELFGGFIFSNDTPYARNSLGGVVNRSGVGRVQDLLLAVSRQRDVYVPLRDLPAAVAIPVHPGRRFTIIRKRARCVGGGCTC